MTTWARIEDYQEMIALRAAKDRDDIASDFDHLKAKLEADFMVINHNLNNPRPEPDGDES